MPSVIEEVVLGVFRPGTNNSTFQTLNYTLYALFVSIAFMFWSGTANVHSFVLLFLAVGLFFSVNWCVRARIKTHCTHTIDILHSSSFANFTIFDAIQFVPCASRFMSELHADASNPTGDADAATEAAEPVEESAVASDAAASTSTPTSSAATVTAAIAPRQSTRKSTTAASSAVIADEHKPSERPKRTKAAKAL